MVNIRIMGMSALLALKKGGLGAQGFNWNYLDLTGFRWIYLDLTGFS